MVSENQETVRVSTVLVEMTPERGAQILPSVLDNLMSIAEGFQPEYGSCSARGLLWGAGSMLQEGADLTEGAVTVTPHCSQPTLLGYCSRPTLLGPL